MSCDGTGFVVVSSVISESEQDYVLVNWNGIRTMQLNVPLYQILRNNNLIPQHASMFWKSQQLPIYYSFNGRKLSLNQVQKRSVSSAEPCPTQHCYGDFIISSAYILLTVQVPRTHTFVHTSFEEAGNFCMQEHF